jgi:hypothetical protein
MVRSAVKRLGYLREYARGGLAVAAAKERSSASSSDLDTGSVIDGRYRVVGRVGRGGAGSVFHVRDVASGKDLALKRLAPDARGRMEALFEREYYTLSGLRHPNVVEVYEYGSTGGKPYYTMELLRGADLSGIAPVAHRVALAYVRDAAKALAPLHARHLLHRDVAPRNLWLSESGCLKLIDFGALTAFGTPGDVVGTPPFVPPEALGGQALDQRTDLYALGALLYWLLTGQHAYPARSLRDLPGTWEHAVEPPSQLIKRLGRDDLPEVPEEVDSFALALLSQDPSARPATAGEVIDRIASLLGSARSEAEDVPAELIVARPAFAGRQRERKHFARQLQLAFGKRGGATVIEAERGLGSTRLLAELGLEARLEGAVGIVLDGADVGASALAAWTTRLLDARPEAALNAFAPFARPLGALHPALFARLGLTGHPSEHSLTELRVQALDSFVGGVLALAEAAPLVLLVDDVGRCDEMGLAALALLAERAAGARLLIVAAGHLAPGTQRSAGLRALGRVSRRLTLRPLSLDETAALVRSLVADVPYLSRLVERLHRATHGNPREMTELLRELIETKVIRQVDGTWVLPQELPEAPFTRSRDDSLGLRLARLSPEARQLARILSVRRGLIPLGACKSAVDVPQRALFEALEQLTRNNVLAQDLHGYHFLDDAVRTVLRGELSPAEAERAHLAIGRYLFSMPDASGAARFDAAVHMLEGGDGEEAPGAVVRLIYAELMADSEGLEVILPRVERANAIFEAQGRSDYARSTLLATLTTAGFFNDRRLIDRYGRPSVDLLCRITGLTLAARIAPYVGGAIALAVGLLVAGVRIALRRRDPCVLSLQDYIVQCVNTCSSMAGASAVCIDADGALHFANKLRPFAGFGGRHPLSLFAAYPQALALAVSDRFTEAEAALLDVQRRLHLPGVKRILSKHSIDRYYYGTLYALGALMCWRDDPKALAIAEELESTNLTIYTMSADQMRALFYGTRGDPVRYEEYRHRAEVHAIKRGTAWQIETWMPGAMIAAAYRSQDAMAMKHAVEQLERLEKRTPSLSLLRKRAQGAYLVLRRRPAEALPVLETCLAEKPRAVVGWARGHGVYARALNATGQHARALEITTRVLASMDEKARGAWAMTLMLSIEHALARSGLGDHRGAHEELLNLLAASGRAGALTRGNVYEALASVTRALGDTAQSEAYFSEMAVAYRSTGIPSLAAHLQVLLRQNRRAAQGGSETREFDFTLTGTAQGGMSIQLMHNLDLALGNCADRTLLAQRATALLAEQSMSPCAALWLNGPEGVQLAGRHGELDPEPFDAWVRERLASAADDDVTQTDFLDGGKVQDPDQREVEGRSYQLLLLVCSHDGRDVPVAGVVVERSASMRTVSHDLLRALAGKLFQPVTVSFGASLPTRDPR